MKYRITYKRLFIENTIVEAKDEDEAEQIAIDHGLDLPSYNRNSPDETWVSCVEPIYEDEDEEAE